MSCFWEGYVVLCHFKEVLKHHMYLFVGIVNTSIVICILKLNWVYIHAHTKPALSCKLNQVSPNSAASIHHISRVLTKYITNSLCSMLGNSFWCHRIPTFIVQFDTSVVFTEQVVPFLIEFFDVLIIRLLNFRIGVVISPRALIPIVGIWMINELF